MRRKLRISNSLESLIDKSDILSEFILYCQKELDLKNPYEIKVVDCRKSHDITTTAHYRPGMQICTVYGKNRALVDICRSVCHEMVHMMQDEKGELFGHIQDAGGYHEDQANALAGELIKRFVGADNKRGKIYESKKRKIIF